MQSISIHDGQKDDEEKKLEQVPPATPISATTWDLNDPRFKLPVCCGRRFYCSTSNVVFELGEQIGAGAAAVVYRCRRVLLSTSVHDAPRLDMSHEFAAKIINLRGLRLKGDYEREKEKLRREVSILRSLHHPCIVNLAHAIETKEELFLVMDLVKGGELFYKIIEHGALTEDQTRYTLLQVLEALRYMHSKGVIHRDLKPENILVSEEVVPGFFRIQVADFGLAKLVIDEISAAKTFVGTPQYWAPEVLESAKSPNTSYGPQVDLWSLGCVIYIMLGGAYPFDNRLGPVENLIKNAQYHFRYVGFQRVSDMAKNIIRGLLTVDPNKRLTLADVFEHPWVKNYRIPLGVPPLPLLKPLSSTDAVVTRPTIISAQSLLEAVETAVIPDSSNIVHFQRRDQQDDHTNTSFLATAHSDNAESMPPITQVAPDPCNRDIFIGAYKVAHQHAIVPDEEVPNGVCSSNDTPLDLHGGNKQASKLEEYTAIGQMHVKFSEDHSSIIPPTLNRQETRTLLLASPFIPENLNEYNANQGTTIVPAYHYLHQTWLPASVPSSEKMNSIPQHVTELSNDINENKPQTSVVTDLLSMQMKESKNRHSIGESSQNQLIADNKEQFDENGRNHKDNDSVSTVGFDGINGPWQNIQTPVRAGRPCSSEQIYSNSFVKQAEFIFNFEELLCLQISVMKKFHWASIVLRNSPEASKQISQCIVEARNVQTESSAIVAQFQTTCSSVLGLLPDLSLAVSEKKIDLAICLFEDIRKWVLGIREQINVHQERVDAFIRHVNDLVEAVQCVKTAGDKTLIGAASAAVARMEAKMRVPLLIPTNTIQFETPYSTNSQTLLRDSRTSTAIEVDQAPTEETSRDIQSITPVSTCIKSADSGSAGNIDDIEDRKLSNQISSIHSCSRTVSNKQRALSHPRSRSETSSKSVLDGDATFETIECETFVTRGSNLKVRAFQQNMLARNRQCAAGYQTWYDGLRDSVFWELQRFSTNALSKLAQDYNHPNREPFIDEQVKNSCNRDRSSDEIASTIANELLDLLFISPASWLEFHRRFVLQKCLVEETYAGNDCFDISPSEAFGESVTSSSSSSNKLSLANKTSRFSRSERRSSSTGRFPMCEIEKNGALESYSRKTCNQTFKTQEVLIRALDELRRIDRILRKSTAFWLNVTVVTERLCQMKTHAERLLLYTSSSEAFTERLLERLRDYEKFWSSLWRQSYEYVQQSSIKLAAMDELALTLASEADRIDTASALLWSDTEFSMAIKALQNRRSTFGSPPQ